MSIRIEQSARTAYVTFPYDPEAVALIKTIAGRRWDRQAKHWTIDADDVPLAARRFDAAGFHVIVNGRDFTAAVSSAANGTHPLRALFAVLPRPLRPRSYKALAHVLHPDAGGDTALMQQLVDAYKATK